MAKRRRKSDPRRFKDKGFFSWDPIRRGVFRWGLLAGLVGGFFMLRPEIVWQIVGIFVIVFIANHRINKAADYIPRWQATIVSFLGVMVAMFGVILVGTLIINYVGPNGASG